MEPRTEIVHFWSFGLEKKVGQKFWHDNQLFVSTFSLRLNSPKNSHFPTLQAKRNFWPYSLLIYLRYYKEKYALSFFFSICEFESTVNYCHNVILRNVSTRLAQYEGVWEKRKVLPAYVVSIVLENQRFASAAIPCQGSVNCQMIFNLSTVLSTKGWVRLLSKQTLRKQKVCLSEPN